MKINAVNMLTKYTLYVLFAIGLIATGCNNDKDEVAPAEENEVEVFTDVKLTFTNTANAADKVEARASDPDGTGVKELIVLDTINLDSSVTYKLTFEIANNLKTPGENVLLEIKEEDKEHQFFFEFTSDIFSSPTGNGNIDGNTTGTEAINYLDKDGNGNPVGLETSWTTASKIMSNGKFRVKLKHQPDVKTATSTANDGDTDFDLSFVLNLK